MSEIRNYVVCHYEKCTGPPVSYSTHIERRKANGMEEHIPYNVKRREMTRHNREFIEEARKIGRTAAIEKRLNAVRHQIDKDGNPYERKIRDDQVCCIEIMLSASQEGMAEIISKGLFDDWCRESIKWAQDTHGAENIVSAVLHMDEETPHIHVSLVPVVRGESKKQRTTKQRAAKDKEKAKLEGSEPPKKKRRYKKKADENTLRLCADDVMTRRNLKMRQTEYGKAMEKFGLRRGEEGSPARHKELADYYREQSKLEETRLDEVLKELEKKDRLLKKKEAELKEKETSIKDCDKEIGARKKWIEMQNEQIADKNKTIGDKKEEITDKNREIISKNRQLVAIEKEISGKAEELSQKKAEVAKQQKQLDGLSDLKENFDIILAGKDSVAIMMNSYIEREKFVEQREKAVAQIEAEALERIKNAPVGMFAKKEVAELAKENAGLKQRIAQMESAMVTANDTVKFLKTAKEKAESKLDDARSTTDKVHQALERRHPVERKLLAELVSIGIEEPKYQDAILEGTTLNYKKWRFTDPATGKQIPEEYAENISIRREDRNGESFISMCGHKIADFFRNIWAKVEAALGLKRKQEQEAERQRQEAIKQQMAQRQSRQQKPEAPTRSKGIKR